MYSSTWSTPAILTYERPLPVGYEGAGVPRVLLQHEVHLEPVVSPRPELHLAVLNTEKYLVFSKSIYTNSLAMLTHKQYEDNEPTSAIFQAFRLDIFGNYAKSSLETHKSSCLTLLSLCC